MQTKYQIQMMKEPKKKYCIMFDVTWILFLFRHASAIKMSVMGVLKVLRYHLLLLSLYWSLEVLYQPWSNEKNKWRAFWYSPDCQDIVNCITLYITWLQFMIYHLIIEQHFNWHCMHVIYNTISSIHAFLHSVIF